MVDGMGDGRCLEHARLQLKVKGFRGMKALSIKDKKVRIDWQERSVVDFPWFCARATRPGGFPGRVGQFDRARLPGAAVKVLPSLNRTVKGAVDALNAR